MKFIIISLILAILFWGFSFPWAIRTYARIRADQIIHGRRPFTEKLINRCISILVWSNEWITNRTAKDQNRISELRKCRNKIQKPHG